MSLRLLIYRRIGIEQAAYRYIMRLTLSIIFILFSAKAFSTAWAQNFSPLQDRYWTELHDAMKAQSNPLQVYANVTSIKGELIQYSSKNFPIFPIKTTGSIGIAADGGTILLEISTLGKPKNVLAFWMAHEWAHQDLSHNRNSYSTYADMYRAAQAKQMHSSAWEDEADLYAARFIAMLGYSIDGVLSNLCSLGESKGNHSSGAERAVNVATVYSNLTGKRAVPPCRISGRQTTFGDGAAKSLVPNYDIRGTYTRNIIVDNNGSESVDKQQASTFLDNYIDEFVEVDHYFVKKIIKATTSMT